MLLNTLGSSSVSKKTGAQRLAVDSRASNLRGAGHDETVLQAGTRNCAAIATLGNALIVLQ